MVGEPDGGLRLPEEVRRELPWCPHCEYVLHEGRNVHEFACPVTLTITALAEELTATGGCHPDTLDAKGVQINNFHATMLCRIFVMDRA